MPAVKKAVTEKRHGKSGAGKWLFAENGCCSDNKRLLGEMLRKKLRYEYIYIYWRRSKKADDSKIHAWSKALAGL